MQRLLDSLSPQRPEDLLASAERRETELQLQLKDAVAKAGGLAGKVRQCHLDERAAWDHWLAQPDAEMSDLRQALLVLLDRMHSTSVCQALPGRSKAAVEAESRKCNMARTASATRLVLQQRQPEVLLL